MNNATHTCSAAAKCHEIIAELDALVAKSAQLRAEHEALMARVAARTAK
jgi:hypothetical protein